MQIRTDQDIDGTVALALREAAGLGQRKFWRSVGVSQPSGVHYEHGRRIPKPVRALIFFRYVAELDADTSTIEGARAVRKLVAKR